MAAVWPQNSVEGQNVKHLQRKSRHMGTAVMVTGSEADELNFVSERTHSGLLTELLAMYEDNSGDTLGRCSVLIQSRCLDISVLGNQGPWETTYFFYPDGKHLLLLKDPQGFWVVRLALASLCFCGAVFYCLETKKGGKASKHVQLVISAHLSIPVRERT